MKKVDVTQAQLLEPLGYTLSTLQRKLAGVSEISAEDVALIGNYIGVPAARMMDEASRKLAAAHGEDARPDEPVSGVSAQNVTAFPKRPTTGPEFDAYQGDRAAHPLDEESERDEDE